MDNLTHGLLGAAIGMLRRREGGPETDLPDSPASHTDRAVVWGAVLAAELPDLDVFFGSKSMDYYTYHRGLTHSLVGAPVVALIATGIVALIWRRARWQTVYVWSLAGVLIGHLVNDWMTGWGTRLLLPFSEARLALDWVPIIDLLYTLPLLLSVYFAWRLPFLRRKMIAGCLTYLLIYTVGYRGLSQALIQRSVRNHYGTALTRVQVSPDLFDPRRWQFVADLGDRYEQGWTFPLYGMHLVRTVPKEVDDEVVRAVRGAPELKPFFEQFAFARITYHKTPEGFSVTSGDLRYDFAGRSMQLQALLSPSLQLLQVIRSR